MHLQSLGENQLSKYKDVEKAILFLTNMAFELYCAGSAMGSSGLLTDRIETEKVIVE